MLNFSSRTPTKSQLYPDVVSEKKVDLKTVNIKKLKVKELKKILEQHGQDCKGCTEKSEYVTKVEAIAASQGRTEL